MDGSQARIGQVIGMTAFIAIVAGGATIEKWGQLDWRRDLGLGAVWVVIVVMTSLLGVAAIRALVVSRARKTGNGF